MTAVYVDIFSALGEVLSVPGPEMVAVQIVRKGRWLVVRFSLDDRTMDTTVDLGLMAFASTGVRKAQVATEFWRSLQAVVRGEE